MRELRKRTCGGNEQGNASLVRKIDAGLSHLEYFLDKESDKDNVLEVVASLKAEAGANLKAKNFNGALKCCDKAIALQPDEATHWGNRSLALLRLGRSREACRAAEEAVARDATWAKGHYRLGMARKALAEEDDAVALEKTEQEHVGGEVPSVTTLKLALSSLSRALELQEADDGQGVNAIAVAATQKARNEVASALKVHLGTGVDFSEESGILCIEEDPRTVDVNEAATTKIAEVGAAVGGSNKCVVSATDIVGARSISCDDTEEYGGLSWLKEKCAVPTGSKEKSTNLPALSKSFPVTLVTEKDPSHSNQTTNRWFVATRALVAGEEVWREKPLALAVTPAHCEVVCHTCLKPITGSDTAQNREKRILGCGDCRCAVWCSEQCRRTGRRLHMHECRALRNEGRSSTDGGGKSSKKALGLRLFMQLIGESVQPRTENASASDNVRRVLSDLYAHEDDVGDSQDSRLGSLVAANLSSRRTRMGNAVKGLKQLAFQSIPAVAALASSMRASSMLSDNEIRHLIGVAQTNGFMVTNLDGHRIANALFAGASFFNHECDPNTAVGFLSGCRDEKGSGYCLRLIMRTIRPVKKGESLSIGYTDLWRPTAVRRQKLLASKGFLCHCVRCATSLPQLGDGEKQVYLDELPGSNTIDDFLSKARDALSAAETDSIAGIEAKTRAIDGVLLIVARAFREADAAFPTETDSTHAASSCNNATHWQRFELHSLATTCLLRRPSPASTPLPRGLAKALLDQGSSSTGTEPLVVLRYHAERAVRCAEALAKRANQHDSTAPFPHPRLALSLRDYGNALMLTAGKEKQQSGRASASQQYKQHARDASALYGSAAAAMELYWGREHSDVCSLWQLHSWARCF